MISQHLFREWLDAVREQAITWANVDPDLCSHLASLGPNELMRPGLSWYYKQQRQDVYLTVTSQELHTSCLHRRAVMCPMWDFVEKIDHIIMTPHCIYSMGYMPTAQSFGSMLYIFISFLRRPPVPIRTTRRWSSHQLHPTHTEGSNRYRRHHNIWQTSAKVVCKFWIYMP